LSTKYGAIFTQQISPTYNSTHRHQQIGEPIGHKGATTMLERDKFSSNAVIKVIGVGGAGGNAINTMIEQGLSGVEFIAANTDVQALASNLAPVKIQLGRELTKGLGAGANPEVGRDAALEDKAIIQEVLAGADMVFVTAGTGGGTGTGAAPIIAQVAREIGALTVGVVTKPFSFEGKRRKIHSEQGIHSLKSCVDTLITIPNQRLLSIAPPQMSMLDGFKLADEVLLNAVKGISDIINIPGRVNVDFADVRTIMSEMGMALMGIGTATGENRAIEAARAAINSPLLEDVDIEGATGILINITGSSGMTLHEISEASTLIQEAVHEDANIIFGSVVDEEMGDTLRVTVIATGFDHARVSLPESHNKIYPSANNGYGYHNTNQPTGTNGILPQGFGANQSAHNQRPMNTGYGYGNGQTDARMNQQQNHSMPNGMNNRMDSGLSGRPNSNSVHQHTSINTAAANPVAAGLSLRSPYEVGQPVNHFRRPQESINHASEGIQNSYGRHPTATAVNAAGTFPNTTSPGASAASQQSLALQNAAQSANQLRHALASHANTESESMSSDDSAVRSNFNSSKNEFEELTQWTLELSRQSSGEGHPSKEGGNSGDHGSEAPLISESVLKRAMEENENENEKALRLARELAEISPDEGDFETPAFLRRKDDHINRGI
jgi:cell division protein FtsZ